MNTYIIHQSKGLKEGCLQWTCTAKNLRAAKRKASNRSAREFLSLRHLPMSLYDVENDTMWHRCHHAGFWYRAKWKMDSTDRQKLLTLLQTKNNGDQQ